MLPNVNSKLRFKLGWNLSYQKHATKFEALQMSQAITDFKVPKLNYSFKEPPTKGRLTNKIIYLLTGVWFDYSRIFLLYDSSQQYGW